MFANNLVGIFGTLLVWSLAPPVCAEKKFPDYPERPAGDYSVTAEKAGLIIGVQPVEDLKDQKTYFNTELTRKGFIPVFVVMQNGSSGDSFLFDKTKIMYGSDTSTASGPNVESKAGQMVGLASLAVLSPAGLVVAAILNSKASQVEHNILEREIQSKTLSPGRSEHGFLYIPVPKNSARPKIHLRLPVTRSGTDEPIVLDLVF